MMSLIGILLLHFFIGFISDIGLNYLSRQSYATGPIKALEIYFKRKSIKGEPQRTIISAINAGLTIVFALIFTMLLSIILFGFSYPMKIKQLIKFVILAFIIGYAFDIIIYKTQLFGKSLNPYYKVTGAGLWGALAFVFSILLGYAYIKMFV